MSQVVTVFDDIVDTYYRAWFRYHPEAAVDAGVEGYAHLLTPAGAARRGALVCLNDELRVELEELDAGKLDADRALDLTLLQGAIQVEKPGAARHRAAATASGTVAAGECPLPAHHPAGRRI